ncbi:MAG: sulfatase [Bacteroidota bacterium]
MHYCSFLYLYLIFSCLACQSVSKEEQNQAPNIVFILADDLGWADLGIYGNTFNETPNLDKMAAEGMRFTNAYAAAPVCSPTRASIQSGQYPAHVGITDFIPGHWRPYESHRVPINRTQYLPEEIVSLGEVLQAGGYKTGYFGKWHLGWGDEHMPGNQGYEDWRIQQGGTFYNLKSKKAIRPMDSSLNDEVRLSTVLTDYSLNFIEENKDQPFFLFLSHYDVHVQLDADMDLIEKYLAKEKPDDYPGNAIYAAMIEHIDRSLERVVSKLEELGLSENTLLVFFSDNGGLKSRFDEIPLLAKSKLSIYEDSELQYIATSNAPLRAEKGTVYEGGIREPLLIKWPGKIKEGSLSDALVSSVDFYPTFMEIAGIDPIKTQKLDGESMLPILKGENVQGERSLFWHYPVYHHDVPAGAIRKGKWKLIESFTEDRFELYDLENDPGESKNLVELYPDLVRELATELAEWRKEVGAEMPVANPEFDQSRRKEWGKHPGR